MLSQAGSAHRSSGRSHSPQPSPSACHQRHVAQQAACAALFRCPVTVADAASQRAYLGEASRCASLRVGASVLGWGSLDDLLAAGYTLVVLAILMRFTA